MDAETPKTVTREHGCRKCGRSEFYPGSPAICAACGCENAIRGGGVGRVVKSDGQKTGGR